MVRRARGRSPPPSARSPGSCSPPRLPPEVVEVERLALVVAHIGACAERPLAGDAGLREGGGGGGGDFSDLFGGGSPNDIFANLFGGGGVRRGPRKGQDLQTESTITFKEAVFGTTLELKLSTDGGKPQTITARVPAGVNDGAKIRVKGKGAPGEAGPGDLFILLHVKAHPIFSRKAENIVLTLPVTFVEATLGADIKVPTLDGEEVTVRLAPGTPNGRTLRVKGRGIKKGSVTGDLLATIDVQVPQKIEGEASEALKKFAEATASHDVRMEFRAKASE